MKKVLLIISCIVLVLSIGTFIYLSYENKKITTELNNLNDSIKKVQDRITNQEKEKDEKQNEYEKLQEEVKEKIEELEIWEEIKGKLEQSLA